MAETARSETSLDDPAEIGGRRGVVEDELPLRQYLRALRRGRRIIVVCVLAAVAAAAAWSFTRESEYRAGMKILVGVGGGLLQPGSFGASPEPLTQTMSGLLQSDIVAEAVIEEQALRIPLGVFFDRLDVTSRPESTVLDVTYTAPDRGQPVRVLQSVGRQFGERVLRDLAPTAPTGQDGAPEQLTATVFDPPRLEPQRVSPRPLRTIAIAAAAGLVVALMLVVFRDALTRRA